jgi:hypothetical protein
MTSIRKLSQEPNIVRARHRNVSYFGIVRWSIVFFAEEPKQF